MAFPKASQPSSVKLSSNRHQVCISQICDYELGLSPLCGDAAYLVANVESEELGATRNWGRECRRDFSTKPRHQFNSAAGASRWMPRCLGF